VEYAGGILEYLSEKLANPALAAFHEPTIAVSPLESALGRVTMKITIHYCGR
jgi:hypothetical protein